MTSSALTILLALASLPAGAQDPAPADAAPADDAPAASGPYAALRPHRSCEAVLPPLDGADADAPPPLCERGPAGSRCVAPSRIRGQQKRPSQVLDPEDENPPPVPPYTLMYSPGIKHIFGWLKSLNTCRFQAGSAVPRPDEPVKGEFQTDESFQQQLAAFEADMTDRAARVVAVQKSTEPLLSEITFVATVPIESVGEYSAEKGCFFPGPLARIELDEYKSRDTIYRTDGEAVSKFRLVPRKEAPALVTGAPMAASQTLKEAYFDEDTPKTDLVFQAHPLCVSPEEGTTIRDQMERNAIRDFGIHFELAVQFRLEGDEPQWVIGGEFVNRTQPELSTVDTAEDGAPTRNDRAIPVNPSATPPDVAEPDDDPSSYEIPLDETGCQAVSGAVGAWWLGAVLLSSRRRRRRSSSIR